MKRRTGCARSVHAADSMNLEQFHDYLGLMGFSYRDGRFEFNGFHFYWTPDPPAADTVADVLWKRNL